MKKQFIDQLTKPGTVIHISGITADDPRYGFQVKAVSIRILNPEEYQKEDYIAVSKRSTAEMEQEIMDFINQIQNPSLKELMTSWYLKILFSTNIYYKWGLVII